MLMMLNASLPKVTNTTTTTPPTVLAYAAPALAVRWQNQCRIEKGFVDICEVQAVLVEVCRAFWFIPDNPHLYIVATIYLDVDRGKLEWWTFRMPVSKVPKRLLNARAFMMTGGHVCCPLTTHAYRAHEPDIDRASEGLSRTVAAAVAGAADA